jgi:hypothetical protein
VGYDLVLRPRADELDEDAFLEYFDDRRYFRFPDEDPDVAAYFNPSTEVYFHFRWTEPCAAEPKGALEFAINFYRPPSFAIEAETELADVIEALDLAVEDSQTDGIRGDVYDGDRFLAGWQHGNRAAYRAVLAEADPPKPWHLPVDQLERIWRWNFTYQEIEEANGGTYAASLICYATYDEKALVKVASFSLEKALLLPKVDHVFVKREGRGTFVTWDEIANALGLVDGNRVDHDPWPYWAVTRSKNAALERVLTNQRRPAPITSLDVQDVHASEDVAG